MTTATQIQASPELPREVMAWNAMTPMQRYEVMQKAPYHKSETKRFRGCMAYLREQMKAAA